MRLPTLTIIGKPNAGKSTFFNRFSKEDRALVFDSPGVTRDLKSREVAFEDFRFVLTDTGGMLFDTEDGLKEKVTEKAFSALREADAVLFFADFKSGWTREDEDILVELRRLGRSFYLVVNKTDSPKNFHAMGEFYETGATALYPISSTQGTGVPELLEDVFADLGVERDEEGEEEDEAKDGIRVSVLGRPNVGKSTLINRFLGEEKCIAHDEPGTTRDSVEWEHAKDRTLFRLVDTAGLRRRSRITGEIEGMSASETLAAIRKSHVVIVVLDAEECPVDQDLKLISRAVQKGKPLILAVNKCDLIEEKRDFEKKLKAYLEARISFSFSASIVMISALSGLRVDGLLDRAEKLYRRACTRFVTSQLKSLIDEISVSAKFPAKGRKKLKILHCKQLDGLPLCFLFKVNDASILNDSFKKFVMNRFTYFFRLEGIPLHFIWKSRESTPRKRGLP